MTEADWLASTDPTPMLEYLRATEREKEQGLREFAFGCCYRTWQLMPDDGKRLLEAVRLFGEGAVTRHHRDSAVAAFRTVYGRYGPETAILRAVYHCKNISIDAFTAAAVAADTANAVSNAAEATARSAAYLAERAGQVNLLRCLFGNPFRPARIDAAWRAWNGSLLVKLAHVICAERRFQDLPILADALEELGCTDADILGHLRGSGPHVRGCWAVDLVLRKD